jgi:hypothetical protein
VNANEHDPKACGFATVAFVRGRDSPPPGARTRRFRSCVFRCSAYAPRVGFSQSFQPPMSRYSKSRNMQCSWQLRSGAAVIDE